MKRKFYANKLTVRGLLLPLLKQGRSFFLNLFFALLGVLSFNASHAQVGEALYFDGTDDKVDLPFIISGSYTKEAWIYIDDPATLSGFPNILTGTQTSLQLANGVLTAGHAGAFNEAVDQTGPLSLNTWYHIAVTYNATTQAINLYKNGVLVSVPGSTAPPYTETTMKIGTFNNSFYFRGKIDEVRFWSVARTGAEIAANMNCALTGDEPFLTAYYNFNEGVAGGNNTGLTVLSDQQDKCVPYDGTLVGFALTGATSNWVAPGAATATACATNYENISLSGNSLCITSGDVTPSLTDSTNFGDYTTAPITRTFTVQNTGLAPLTVSSATITGPDAADFTITSSPVGTIAPGGTAALTITFNPTSPGSFTPRTATVTIGNSDADEASFTFAITAYNRGLGQALAFDGVDDSVYLPVSLNGSYTKEVWINTAQLTGFPNLITGTGTALFLNAGRLSGGHAPNFNQVLDPTPITPNTPVHVAITFDASTGTMNLYKNGTLVSTGVAPAYTEPSLRLGTFLQSNFYNGTMDEVRIWNIARTQAEISGSMNCNLTGDEFFLQAYYKFNQGAAGGDNTGETTLRDTADKCIPQNGTLYNFALTGATSNWVQPGAPLSGTCAGTYQNIAISGNGNCIVPGDNTPTQADYTDFGLNYTNAPTDRTFTITNTGSADLDLTAPLAISGPDAGLFTVTSPPATLLAPGASTTFTVRFISPTAGTFTASILAANTDPDEAAYSYAIQASASTTTPVTLLSFDGVLKGSSVKLVWKTTAELNNSGFEVLRSNAAQTKWESIGFVAGTNASTGSVYGFTDYAPLKGINIYKLRQVDINGSARLSDIVPVNNTDRSTVINTYPNPFQQSFKIAFNDPTLLNTTVKVKSVTGNTVTTISLRNYSQDVNLSGVPAGMYFISFANGQVMRVVKQ